MINDINNTRYDKNTIVIAQVAGTLEFTDCFSAEE